jgi:hypothetical protein
MIPDTVLTLISYAVQVEMLPMQNALYQAAVNNFRSQAAAARRQAPKSGAARYLWSALSTVSDVLEMHSYASSSNV